MGSREVSLPHPQPGPGTPRPDQKAHFLHPALPTPRALAWAQSQVQLLTLPWDAGPPSSQPGMAASSKMATGMPCPPLDLPGVLGWSQSPGKVRSGQAQHGCGGRSLGGDKAAVWTPRALPWHRGARGQGGSSGLALDHPQPAEEGRKGAGTHLWLLNKCAFLSPALIASAQRAGLIPPHTAGPAPLPVL